MGTTTLNPTFPSLATGVTLSNGNLTATATTTAEKGATGLHPKISGLYYFECTFNAISGSGSGMGIRTAGSTYSAISTNGLNAASVYRSTSIAINGNTSFTSLGGGLLASSTACCAVNLNTKLIWFRKGAAGNWNGNALADPATGVGGYDISTIVPGAGLFPYVDVSTSGDAGTMNFGATSYVGVAPSGFGNWDDSAEPKVYLDIEAHAIGTNQTNSNAASITLPGTSGTNRIVCVLAHNDGANGARGTQRTVTSVSGGSLAWTKGSAHNWTGATPDGGPGNDTTEIWWALAASALGSTVITINYSGNYDGVAVQVFAVVGANTTAPFDTNGSLPANANSNSSSAATVSGVSTTTTDGMLLAMWGNDGGPTGSLPSNSSGYAAIKGLDNNSPQAWAEIWSQAKSFNGGAISSITVAEPTSFPSWGWSVVAFQSPGTSGTMAATDTKDTFSASSAPAGTWGSTDVKDVWAGAGYPQLKGTMAATDTKDTMAAAAHLIQLDGHATNLSTSAVSTGSVTLTTTQPFDVIVLTATTKGQTISGVSDTAGLTWQRRTQYQPASGGNPSGVTTMDIWWAVAPAKLTADVITLTFTGTTKYEAVAFGVCGADTSSPFDTHNANSTTATNSGVGNPSVSITTDYTHDQFVFGVYGSDLVTEGGVATGMTTFIDGGNGGTGNLNNAAGYVVKNAAQTGLSLSFTQVLGGSANRYLMADAIRSRIDVSGSWASTDLRDTFAAAGYPQVKGTFAATEAKDIFAGTIFAPPRGTLGATEAKDAFAGTGSAAAPLSIDTHAEGASHDTSSATVSITTSHSDEVIILGIMAGGHFTHSHVSTITDTAGLTWKKRHQRYQFGEQPSMEIWWAAKPTAGATTITVNTAATTGFLCVQAIAIAGARTTNPFDTHTGAGYYVDNYGSGNPAGAIYSNASHGLALAFYGSRDIPSDGTVSAGFTWVDRIIETESVGLTGRLEWAYSVASGTKFHNTPVIFGQVAGDNNDRTMMTDVIVSASESVLTPSTNDVIRFFFDGQGQQTIVQLSGTNKSQSLALSTFNPDTICVVAAMVQSSLGARVASVTDDAGHSPGWVRRAIEVGVPGSLSLETWWCHFPTAFTGNITVTLDDSAQPGDIIGFVAVGINGADAFQRGEIWDGDSSLPKVNKDSGVASFQETGNFSSLNADVLELNFAANTGSLFSDGALENFNEDPWLQFQGNFFGSLTGLLTSSAPNFNIAIQFKFNASPVSNDHTELNVTPSPTKWLMITDVMPVGPAIPPTGVWGSTDAKDIATHTGDFTRIGIASPGGWVGFPPNHAALAVTDTKDRATNPGTFTAIWDSNGWIGFVPLHFSFALAEGHDVWASHGWVLGPTTILARWESTETKDRFGFASLYTWYTTPDSTGDRTSRITVTTNAQLGGSSGTPDKLVNGLKGNNAASGIWVTPSQAAPMYFRFDLNTPRVINEAIWFQTGTSAQPGLWIWQGSNDAATWTTLSAAPFVLNSGNTGSVIGDFSTNQTAFRFYQVIQTTNAGGNDAPWLWEINFKVAGFSGAMGATESHERANYQVQLIPKAVPIPARKHRLLIVT